MSNLIQPHTPLFTVESAHGKVLEVMPRAVYLTYQRRTQTMNAWAYELGIPTSTIQSRKRSGLSDAECLTVGRLNRAEVASLERAKCTLCGGWQRSKELFNHRDRNGDPCRGYVRAERVVA